MSEPQLCTCYVLTGGHVAPSASCPIHEGARKSAIDVALEMSLDRDEQHEAFLSAIRALVQQWRERAARLRRKRAGFERSQFTDMDRKRAETFNYCAKQLAALCPAPPEDRK